MTTLTQIGEVHEKLIKKQDEIKNKKDKDGYFVNQG